MIARHLDSQTDGEFNYSCPLQVVVEYGKAGLLFKPFLVPSKTCSCVRVRRSLLMCARARVVCFLGSCGCLYFCFVLGWVVFYMFVYTCNVYV